MNASHYFFALLATIIALSIIALILPKFKKKNTLISKNTFGNKDTLSILYQLCQAVLTDEFELQQATSFITIIKNNQKIALLTLDSKLDNHSRKMGNALIINFNSLPNKKSLEQRLIQDKIIILN